MAGLDEAPWGRTAPRHDGLAACRLCSSGDAAADHDWCPAVRGLICGACCRHALLGDDSRLYVVAGGTGAEEAADDLAAACMGCARGQRWFAEQLRERLTRGPGPC
jgi:hypothetical protein